MPVIRTTVISKDSASSSESRARPPWRILVALFSLFGLIAASGFYWFEQGHEALDRRHDAELTAIASDKARQLGEWRTARVEDLTQMSGALAPFVRPWLESPDALSAEVTALLDALLKSPRYEAALIVDRGGRVRLARGLDPTAGADWRSLAAQVTGSGEAAFSDFRIGEAVRFHIAAPLYAPGDERPAGALILRLDPYPYFYRTLLQWPLISRTAEVLLVRREASEVVFLSQLRHHPDGVGLRMPLATERLIAARAVTGRYGALEGVDYRNVAVIASVQPIPGTPWAIIAKMDRAEALEPIRQLAVRTTLGSLLLSALAAVIAGLWWRNQWALHRMELRDRERERRALVLHYDYLARYANDIILLADAYGRLIEANDRAVHSYGYTRDQLLRLRWGDLTAPGELPNFVDHWSEVAAHDALLYEIRQQRADGTVFPVEISARIIEVEGESFYQAIVRDITDRKRTERKIKRLTQVYGALSQTNQAIIRATDKGRLLAEVARVAVEQGPFGAAWIGELEAGAHRIQRVASAGERQGPQELPLPLPPTDAITAALGQAVQTGTVQVAEGITDEAARRWGGTRSLAALPLRREGVVIGLFAVCSGEAGFFDRQLIGLLEEMAADISFAFDNFEREARRRSTETNLRDTERRYRQLFNGTSSGVAVYQARDGGADFIIKDVNPAVERIERVRREDIVGKSIEAVFPGVRRFGLFDVLQRVWRTGRTEHLDAAYYQDERHAGWRENEVYKLPSGEVVAVYDDITERMLALQELRENEQRLRFVLEGSSDGFWDWNVADDAVYYSPRYSEILGFTMDELESNRAGWEQQVHAEDLAATQAALEAHLAGRSARFEVEHRMRTKSGQWKWILARGKVVERGEQGEPLRFAGAISDVTARREAQEQRRLWSKVFENSGEGIYITDERGRIIAVNRAFVQITGYYPEEVYGHDPAMLHSGLHDEDFHRRVWAQIRERGFWQGESWERRKDGQIYPQWLSITADKDLSGRVTNYLAVFSDISERKEAQARIRFLSRHDALTGLPNRELFYERAAKALAGARKNRRGLALLFVDLDRFKGVNDRLGHTAGDQILQSVALRLTGAVGLDDTVSRQGSDEFVILLSDVAAPADAAHAAEKLFEAMAPPFHAGDEELLLTCSIGISLFPEDGDGVDALLRNAEGAMSYAKQSGRANYQFFAPELNAKALEWLALEGDLRWAVERDELFLDYQPQFDIQSGALVGVEALARWRHPKRGVLLPADFVPIAEESGLIFRIGEWVLREACRQHRLWRANGLAPVPVAVNVSAVQFNQRDFLRHIAHILEESRADARALEVELTETVIMKDPEAAAATLMALKEMGVSVSVDDFGTGYSSLSYLRRFPIDKLKIDRSFVQGMAADPADRAITESIIGLGKALGLKVIAEGVETAEEVALLRSRQCDQAQGFHFSPPLSAADFSRTLVGDRHH